MFDQSRGKSIDDFRARRVASFDDLHQRRPAERADAEEAAAKRRARLAFELARIAAPEDEGARHGPFAGLGGRFENERVRRVEPDSAQELHVRGPLLFGSNHDGSFSRGSKALRSTFADAMRRSSRSPLSSMSRRRPCCAGNLSK